jgi:hypothetical protein
MDYLEKYIKYKTKYLKLAALNQQGGMYASRYDESQNSLHVHKYFQPTGKMYGDCPPIYKVLML